MTPVFVCSYCGSKTTPKIDASGEMPTGTLALCMCEEGKAAWEADHRAKMEARKVASRGVRTHSLVQVGRTQLPKGGLRYRSR